MRKLICWKAVLFLVFRSILWIHSFFQTKKRTMLKGFICVRDKCAVYSNHLYRRKYRIIHCLRFKPFPTYFYIRTRWVYNFVGPVNSNMSFESTNPIVCTESRQKLLLDKTQNPVIFHLRLSKSLELFHYSM